MHKEPLIPARSLHGFIALIGWIVTALGVIGLFYAISRLENTARLNEVVAMMSLIPGIFGIALGLIQVAIAQIGLTVLDQTDTSRELLKK